MTRTPAPVPSPTADSSPELAQLTARVQRNCDIADARFAGNATLCIYLLEMREFYRWEQGQDLRAELDRQTVGDWVIAREQHWETLEDAELEPLVLDGIAHDPFDEEAINRKLAPRGLAYGAGYGQGGRPVFFLGRLEHLEAFDGYRIHVIGEELARDLAAPPAMSREGRIFVRRESVRRMVLEAVEAWQARGRPDDGMARALRAYGHDPDHAPPLERMVDGELEAAVWHEVGEVLAGDFLGPAWQECLSEVLGTREERVLRAVRDHLADMLVTLPALLSGTGDGSLHLYFARLGGMRAALFPQLHDAYEQAIHEESPEAIRRLVVPAREHWLATARELLEQAPEHWPADDHQLPALQPVLPRGPVTQTDRSPPGADSADRWG
ncbi:Sfum_1244 family protein [Thioalkalivibrio sp. ALE19]|uniref:Sfum_1244 family protein n=1 Tax=Thioalkalivibrio sp. ALE19 TaxID=1266909 RepID=UPI00041EC0EB|nr:Sfum_1244 family protein [Thioalkalivibrio sp. ALE19]